MKTHRFSSLLVAAAALALAACDDEEAKPAQAQAQPAAQTNPATERVAAPTPRPSPEDCGSVTPYFPYDSDAPFPEGERGVERLGECLRASLAAGQVVTLVGRADDRGSQTYNYWLGMRRAQRVRGLLVDQGLAASQIKLKSVGEREATGEYSKDRRVDVLYRDSAG